MEAKIHVYVHLFCCLGIFLDHVYRLWRAWVELRMYQFVVEWFCSFDCVSVYCSCCTDNCLYSFPQHSLLFARMTSSLYVIVGECARDKHSQAMRDGFRACMPEMSTDRTEAIFGRIRTGSDWENLLFYVIILKLSKILVVIRFHRFAKWLCIFCHQMQKLCWDYFAIRTVSTFVHM